MQQIVLGYIIQATEINFSSNLFGQVNFPMVLFQIEVKHPKLKDNFCTLN